VEYSSTFASYITGLIEQKRALGYKYYVEAAILKRFDTFCQERHLSEIILNHAVVMDWATRRPGEHPATLQGRLTPVRELAKYMARLGLEAYLMPKGLMPRIPRYVPYIYTNDELKRFFEQTDQCHYRIEVPYRHCVMPVFFRLLYCTGMRLSEARLLKVSDVDLDDGVITVLNAKLGKHRQLPVSPEMLERLRNYQRNVHMLSKPDDWYFPGFGGIPMTLSNVNHNFRRFLWQAQISHGGRGKGPRIHDFRHTTAVHCLRRWVLEGKDLRAYIPILQAFLGHVSFADTAYYLHLTADLFPDITEKVEAAFGFIIPEAGDYDETD
jgi:integrase